MSDKYSISRFLTGYQFPMHLAMIIILILFRLIFIYCFWGDFEQTYSFSSHQMRYDLYKAVIKGMRFDGIVLAYSMIVQLFIALFFTLARWDIKWYIRCSKTILLAFFVFVLAIVNLDLPYFDYFGEHPSKEISEWLFFGNTYSMIFQESAYYLYFMLFISSILLIGLTSRMLTRFTIKSRLLYILEHPIIRFVCITFLVLLSILGTRGQLSTEKLSTNAAHFTDHHLVSQLTIGPLFFFTEQLGYQSKQLDLEAIMSLDTAIDLVKQQLHITYDTKLISTQLNRYIRPNGSTNLEMVDNLSNYNVVFVFMESMSSGFLFRTENNQPVTPFLDSLSQASLFFNHIYSTGIHTNIGVASTYTGWLSVLNKHMMPRQAHELDGIAKILKDSGYATSFFISHHANYDNMDTFLEHSDVDTIFSQLHYDDAARVNSFGVADAYLLPFAVKELSKSQAQPFFASILTVSNHPPYIMPESFRIFDKDEFSAAHYADYNLKIFLETAKKEPWYDNTIFVFFGDHGKLIDKDRYNVQLNLNHIPLIIFSPGIKDPRTISSVGGQIDIAPTVLQLLNKSYKTNSLGNSLLRQDTIPYTVFSTSTHIACISDSLLYTIEPKNGEEKLYRLSDSLGQNILEQNMEKAKVMKDYAVARVIVSNYYYNLK